MAGTTKLSEANFGAESSIKTIVLFPEESPGFICSIRSEKKRNKEKKKLVNNVHDEAKTRFSISRKKSYILAETSEDKRKYSNQASLNSRSIKSGVPELAQTSSLKLSVGGSFQFKFSDIRLEAQNWPS